MAMIKGIDIKYLNRKQVGMDGFHNPVYEYDEETIENVLVAPTSTDDILSANDLVGKRVTYQLAIPKGDAHDWENAVVEFWGQRWKTVGGALEGIEENIPLDWNKKVTVERYG